MREEIATWYWYVRFVIPGQELEYRVWLWPDGRLAHFSRKEAESVPGASLPRDDALAIAEQFVRGHTSIRLDEFELIQDSQQTLPNRVDHDFTWKRSGPAMDNAKYRVWATVGGDRVSRFGEGLDISEEWLRESQRVASQRRLLARVARFAEQLVGLCSVVTLLILVRSRDLRIRMAIALGAFCTVLSVLDWVNDLPQFWLGYSTADSVADYAGTQLVSIAKTAIMTPFLTAMVFVPAEGITRRALPHHIEFSRGLTLRFWQSRAVLIAVLAGFCVAFVHGASVQLLYMAAKPFGVWCPQSAPYYNALDSAMPWLGAITAGVFPAIYEEIVYRMFLIGVLIWLTRRAWLAVLVSALIWGFNHSMYPQEPVYFRGIEVTLVGIFYGIVYLRYGVVATMVSHYVYNAAASSWFLMNSGNTGLKVSATVVILAALMPAAPGLWAWLRGRPMLRACEVNALPYRAPVKEREDEAPPGPPIECLPIHIIRPKTLLLLVGLGVVGMIAGFAVPPHDTFGSWLRVSVTRREAVEQAADFLRSRGVDVAQYRAVATLVNGLNTDATDYVWQQVGEAELDRIWKERFSDSVRWKVRFFRPRTPEEFEVYVSAIDATRTIDYDHQLPEDAPGASLAIQQAQAVAERYLRGSRGIALDRYSLADFGTVDRPHRKDHWFSWEDPSFQVGDAKFRVFLWVLGDEACNATP
ncbi:MAG: CPBP family intramembrane metalloprotease, partial [Candidatus Hydrogenedentes bacterium]|nr:CPBP family intramembrane metalloprotease [Candidatus Hydrogenedentota bacterium]